MFFKFKFWIRNFGGKFNENPGISPEMALKILPRND
jgi:hypothetical protein